MSSSFISEGKTYSATKTILTHAFKVHDYEMIFFVIHRRRYGPEFQHLRTENFLENSLHFWGTRATKIIIMNHNYLFFSPFT